MSKNLPAGWAWATLSDVAQIVLGQSPPGSSYNDYGKGVPFFQGKAEFGDRFPAIRKWTTEPKKSATRGSVLISVRAPVGPTNLAPIDCAIGRGLAALGTLGGISADYVLWAMRQSVGNLVDQATGSTFDAITGHQLRAHSVPIAPLEEQKRIVDALEEHLSRLDAAEATLSATSRKLDAWLTSFLTDACRGPWPKAQLSDIIKSLNNGVFVSRPSAQPPGSPIYRISAVRPLVLRTDDIRYADPVPKMADAYKVESGDILLTRYSGNPRYVGAAAVVPPGGAGILHPDKLIRVVADRSKALPGWIAAYLTVGEGRRGIEQRLKTTAGQVGISGSQLKTAQIAVPPLSHQQDVVAKIGVVQEAQDRVRQQLDAITAQVQALRRSILADAFSGKLVPQNPDDEPASVLLERIAASRPKRSTRRRARM